MLMGEIHLWPPHAPNLPGGRRPDDTRRSDAKIEGVCTFLYLLRRVSGGEVQTRSWVEAQPGPDKDICSGSCDVSVPALGLAECWVTVPSQLGGSLATK